MEDGNLALETITQNSTEVLEQRFERAIDMIPETYALALYEKEPRVIKTNMNGQSEKFVGYVLENRPDPRDVYKSLSYHYPRSGISQEEVAMFVNEAILTKDNKNFRITHPSFKKPLGSYSLYN